MALSDQRKREIEQLDQLQRAMEEAIEWLLLGDPDTALDVLEKASKAEPSEC